MTQYFDVCIVKDFCSEYPRFSDESVYHLYNVVDDNTLTTSIETYCIQCTIDKQKCQVTSFQYCEGYEPEGYVSTTIIPPDKLGIPDEKVIPYKLLKQYINIDKEIEN